MAVSQSGPKDSRSKGFSKSSPASARQKKGKSSSVEQKSKRPDRPATKKKTYSDKELGIPALNMITPVGVQKPKGKKKGKVFVDDAVRIQDKVSLNGPDTDDHC
jgi:60S ribosomal subunit assembly/export protein LOC1